MSIDTIQSEYVFSLRKKRIYKKDRLQNQIWNRSVNFKKIRTEFILFDYIFGYNSFLSFCNLMVFMQNNAVCNSWYECKNKYNRNKSFDVFACPYFLDNIGNPRCWKILRNNINRTSVIVVQFFLRGYALLLTKIRNIIAQILDILPFLLTGKTVFISLIYSLQTLLFIALVLF